MISGMHIVNTGTSVIGSFKHLITFGLIVVSATISAQGLQPDTNSETNARTMGRVEYKLPHELGILTFEVPLHWVGARAEGAEALWIDNDSDGFKENVTLTIRFEQKVADPEQWLDKAVENLIDQIEANAVSDITKAPAQRTVSFDRVVGGYEITQTLFLMYTEAWDKSYLLMLNHSRDSHEKSIDFSKVKLE